MLLAAALCTIVPAIPAAAHGPPTPLAFWGAFGRRVAHCQRIIGRAAALCALRAWDARKDCVLADLQGNGCDQAATDAAIETARLDAVDTVAAGCTDQEALTLVFLGRFEAQTDVVRFCRQLEDAAASAVFLPPADDPIARRCVSAAALATTKLLRQSFRSRQYVLDRIAQRSFSPDGKQAMVDDSTADIGRVGEALGAALRTSCAQVDFAQTYGRPVDSFLELIATRADCLAGTTYAQGGVVCPTPTCGNGMLEGNALTDEECDDGNLTPGDGCSAACTRE